ncbi:MAG: hypothetical protein CO056_01370 [Candidatus Tagabacteria bacterium CG_4_9_14_0_2_um_filter_41_11]|uniref:Penicillin-binding protein 2 n=2 Tax=Candidatus Tagaibacteriota TaxID=1817918 RepID=A0A2M7B9L8_9BACT|nr:MAG: hypothetical protein COS58_00160 [Candidatus Tagabacteria bacterium CG03_land_8_20_14_0_80_41_22]PJC25241.1 MAG: hypothetical protein CO056_01370 [Candidatus Tagabacteria bacterium CG_4_9_14_0_2_um_filter_41_11]
MSKRLNNRTLDPDEIFADSQNIPGFDKYQFEGRLEKPIAKSTFTSINFCFLFLGGLLLSQIIYLEIVKGEIYVSKSETNYLRALSIPSTRGIIYDRNGKELAWNDSLTENGNTEVIRSYSEMPGLGHILGYIGIITADKIAGKDGIEKKYEDVLAGVMGVKLVEMDSKNQVASESMLRPPVNGKNIKLTIDAELQSDLYNILGSVVRERGFGGGAGVILDIHSGETLALTSYPEYNSQILSRGEPEDIIKGYINNKQKPFLNRAISGLYPPGSIIKPMIALAALTEKIISSEKQIFSAGSISLPNPFFPELKSVFMDWKAHGWVDMRRALAISSNVYFYTIGGGYEDVKGLGISKIDKYANLFGFGAKTNIDLDREEEGMIPSPATKALNTKDPIWRIGDTYHASIGQGDFQITPIQAAVYAATVANNGLLLQPYVVIDDSSDQTPKRGKTLAIPPEYFKIVKEGMRLAVLEGTAQGLSGLGIDVAAKTGTAELESNATKLVNSWLIGFLPYNNPRIAFSILLERGKPTNLIGGVYAGRQLLEWMLIHTPQYLSR